MDHPRTPSILHVTGFGLYNHMTPTVMFDSNSKYSNAVSGLFKRQGVGVGEILFHQFALLSQPSQVWLLQLNDQRAAFFKFQDE